MRAINKFAYLLPLNLSDREREELFRELEHRSPEERHLAYLEDYYSYTR